MTLIRGSCSIRSKQISECSAEDRREVAPQLAEGDLEEELQIVCRIGSW